MKTMARFAKILAPMAAVLAFAWMTIGQQSEKKSEKTVQEKKTTVEKDGKRTEVDNSPFLVGSGPRTPPSIKINTSYLDKEFNLKLTKHLVSENDMILILEFTKDSTDLSKLLQVFPPTEADGNKGIDPKVLAYAFDEDNVLLAKTAMASTTEITGITGDAFKIRLSGIKKVAKESAIRKIEFRPASPQGVLPPRAILDALVR